MTPLIAMLIAFAAYAVAYKVYAQYLAKHLFQLQNHFDGGFL